MFPEEIMAAIISEEIDEEDAIEELEEYGMDLDDLNEGYY